MADIYFFRKKFLGQINLQPVLSEDQSWENLLNQMYIDEVIKNGREYVCEGYVNHIINLIINWLVGPKTSCLIVGGVGLGKTNMMRVLMRLFDMLRDPINIPPLRFRPIMFVDAADWSCRCVFDDDLYKEACHCKVLFIDDLGSEEESYYNYGNKCSPVKQVILSRYSQRLPTICSTNLSLEALACKYGNRVADRINELYAIVQYPEHESFRRMV